MPAPPGADAAAPNALPDDEPNVDAGGSWLSHPPPPASFAVDDEVVVVAAESDAPAGELSQPLPVAGFNEPNPPPPVLVLVLVLVLKLPNPAPVEGVAIGA